MAAFGLLAGWMNVGALDRNTHGMPMQAETIPRIYSLGVCLSSFEFVCYLYILCSTSREQLQGGLDDF